MGGPVPAQSGLLSGALATLRAATPEDAFMGGACMGAGFAMLVWFVVTELRR